MKPIQDTHQGFSERQLLRKLFFRLLPYQVLMLIITSINGIVDGLYASNVIGQTAMSAIGLFGPLNHFLYAASMVFVSGSQILYGRYLARDRGRINRLFTVTLVVSGGIGLLTSVVLAISVFTGASRILVSSQPELRMLNDYILGQQLFSFLSMENQRKRTMVASILCFVVNLIFDHLFVAILPWSTFGLGIATSLSEWVFLAFLALYYIRGKSEWKFSMKGCDLHEVPQIVRFGYSGALSRFLEMFRCLIVNFLVLKYVGSVGLSSFAASNSVMAFFWPVVFGIGAVARMLFTVSIGEEDRRSLVDIMKLIMTWGMLIVLVIVAGLVLCAEPLTRLFYRDPSDPVYQYTVMAFRLLPLCMPFSLWSLAYVTYAQATEKKVSVVIAVVDGMVGVVVCSFILIPVMQMNGLYISNILNGVICALIILISAWRALKRFPRSMEDMMAIPDDIGVGPEARIDISVTKSEDVVNVSRQISEFCRHRGIDGRRSYYASLCMEEMAGNVAKHGFTMDNRQHSADIRVVLKDDGGIILRIRDDCTAFDPLAYHNAMQMEEDGKNLGIRMVYGIARNVEYQNLLGMNVLTIQI